MKPHWMRDLISCSWWENEGPVLLRASRPFEGDDHVVVPTSAPRHNAGPTPLEVRARILAIFKRSPTKVFETSDIADRLRMPMKVCHRHLQHLCTDELITRDGARSAVGKYQLAANDDREAAE